MTNTPSLCDICRQPFVGEGPTCGSEECKTAYRLKQACKECQEVKR